MKDKKSSLYSTRRKILKSSLLLLGSSVLGLDKSFAKNIQTTNPSNQVQKHFMDLAIAEAEKAVEEGDWGPFGAVVVRNDELVSTGQIRVLRDLDPTAHAENIAIKEASKKLNSWNLSDCELYTTSRCSAIGLGSVYWANFAKVFYGFEYLEGMPFTRTEIEIAEQNLIEPVKRLIPEYQIDTKEKINKLLEKSFKIRYKELEEEDATEIGKLS